MAVWAVDSALRAQLVRLAREAGFVVRASGRAAEHAKAMADGAVRLVVTVGSPPLPVPDAVPTEVVSRADNDTAARLAARYRALTTS